VSRLEIESGQVLARIISTVASSLELDEVLRAIVQLLSDASGVHACFVYVVEGDGERLVLRAAGQPYEHLIGHVVLSRPRGLAWWAAERNEPAFIPENLFADPRVEYVPELEEERFQSLLCVPIAARDGKIIGVISAHTEAPRVFDQSEVDFVVTSASLVAGAIENATLYAEARARVDELEALTELAEVIATARVADELLPAVVERGLALLGASACHLYLLEPGREELVLRATASSGAGPEPAVRSSLTLAELGPELARGGRASRVAVPLVAGEELLGLLVAEQSVAVDLARAVASHVAVGIKRIELIERLTERNLTKDFFDDLTAGRRAAAEGRAARLGVDLDAPHVVVVAAAADEGFESSLAALAPGSFFDRREAKLRGLLRVPRRGLQSLLDGVRGARSESGEALSVGLSSECAGIGAFAAGFEEANQALLGAKVLGRAGAVVTFDDLGAYTYVLRIAAHGGGRDATVDAVGRIAAYDSERGTSLFATLEAFLERRGSINATSDALFIHPNTLRQRLRRIGELSGIDLRRDDWLMVEIAVKLVRLRLAEATE
jgi:GAF domain-containing protein